MIARELLWPCQTGPQTGARVEDGLRRHFAFYYDERSHQSLNCAAPFGFIKVWQAWSVTMKLSLILPLRGLIHGGA